MIDSTVNQDLNFCSISEKGWCDTSLHVLDYGSKNIHGAQYHTDVIQAWQPEQAGCIIFNLTNVNNHHFVKVDNVFMSCKKKKA